MHVYEDVLILEVVDNDNRPVPPGSFGDKVLVTVFWTWIEERVNMRRHVVVSEPVPVPQEA